MRPARNPGDVLSGFTLGHSITLAVGSSGLVALQVRWVEVAVAISILVAAAHAWHPLVPRGEALAAGGFGLVHGFAFSASLSGAGLTRSQHALALLGFNLGIESMQLVIVLVVMTPLTMLAQRQTRFYGHLRRGSAAAASRAAVYWFCERLAAPV